MVAHSSESLSSARFAADLHRWRSVRSFITPRISSYQSDERDRTNMTGADPDIDCPPKYAKILAY
jgi:hypothetical protein